MQGGQEQSPKQFTHARGNPLQKILLFTKYPKHLGVQLHLQPRGLTGEAGRS